MSAPEIPEEIVASDADRLLTLYAQLTHQIHGMEVPDRLGRQGATELRAERDIVRREILRRCGEG